MAKLVFTPNPTFPATVSIPNPSGEPIELEVTFKHYKKSEYDKIAKEIDKQRTGASKKTEGDVLLPLLAGWSVDKELTAESLNEYCDVYWGFSNAVTLAYLTAMFQGRQGN